MAGSCKLIIDRRPYSVDGECNMAKVKLPAGPAELTPDWLTWALRETGTIGNCSVTSFEYEVIGEGVGLLGQLARVRLQYDKPEAGAPASPVGKFPAAGQANPDLANP